MKNEFVPYEIALAMKELGYNEKCLTYYFEDGTFSDAVEEDEMAFCGDIRFLNHKNSYGENVSAPLYQQAFRWFREKYDLWAEIIWMNMDFEGFKKGANGRIKSKAKTEFSYTFDTYEEAELACLRKLIEIVNQNKDENN